VRETPTWVMTSRKPSAIAEEILQQKGCKVFRVGDSAGKLDLGEVLELLAGEGITRLMVEGGPTVAASFVAADLVDEAVLVRSDKTIGEGIAPLAGMSLDALTQHLQAAGSERLGADTLETYARANAQ
jgi:diaminohydroxyphosphoribosylaminopyrimidine deaminase/5-amino-6-(5-phosphoribosylamino)uracil reductase